MKSFIQYDNPEILKRFGKNWQDFEDITNEQFQFLMNKIYYLYDMNNVGSMSSEIINFELNANGIPILTDSLNGRRSARRHNATNFKRKGDPNVYLDLAESIVGTRGIIFSGADVAGNKWGIATWPNSGGYNAMSKKWPGNKPYLEIWINVKTNDLVKINQILDIYRLPIYRPAYLQIYLTDDTYAILGVV